MRALFPLVWLAAIACGDPSRLDRDAFPSATADAFCERLRECARGDFDRTFFGMSDCLEHLERDFFELDRGFDDAECEYDAKSAARAWNHLWSMSCEEFYEEDYLEDYDRVWDCDA